MTATVCRWIPPVSLPISMLMWTLFISRLLVIFLSTRKVGEPFAEVVDVCARVLTRNATRADPKVVGHIQRPIGIHKNEGIEHFIASCII
jgi:hypothetical protein